MREMLELYFQEFNNIIIDKARFLDYLARR